MGEVRKNPSAKLNFPRTYIYMHLCYTAVSSFKYWESRIAFNKTTKMAKQQQKIINYPAGKLYQIKIELNMWYMLDSHFEQLTKVFVEFT